MSFVQVPVINKTESIFKRDRKDFSIVLSELSDEFKELMEKETPIFTVKTDGTCGMICRIDGNYYLMRRQDVKKPRDGVKNRNKNYDYVMKNGEIKTIAGMPCYVTKITRGNENLSVPFYIFQLDENLKPEMENDTHIIGFTPLHKTFGEDKYANTIIKQNVPNGTPGMELYTTIFNGSLDIEVKALPVEEIMNGREILTVEIMGSKIANKYSFKNDMHFINPHGSIIFPESCKPSLDQELLRQWFKNDGENRWADIEGFVVHFPKSNKKFKVHRGHVGLEETWQKKKESGIKFT